MKSDHTVNHYIVGMSILLFSMQQALTLLLLQLQCGVKLPPLHHMAEQCFVFLTCVNAWPCGFV